MDSFKHVAKHSSIRLQAKLDGNLQASFTCTYSKEANGLLFRITLQLKPNDVVKIVANTVAIRC